MKRFWLLGLFEPLKEFNPNPFIAKALALVTAIQFCKDAGFNKLVMKGNAIQIVKLLKEDNQDWS